VVKNITDYGAFVDRAHRRLLHVTTSLAAGHHPTEVLTIGSR